MQSAKHPARQGPEPNPARQAPARPTRCCEVVRSAGGPVVVPSSRWGQCIQAHYVRPSPGGIAST